MPLSSPPPSPGEGGRKNMEAGWEFEPVEKRMNNCPDEPRGKPEESGQGLKPLVSLGKGIIRIMEGFNLFLFVLLLVLAVTQVLFRYMLMIPLPWTEELARFTLVWVTFLGSASVTRRKLHIAVDYFIARLPVKTSQVFSLCSYSLILVFLATVLWGALIMMEEAAPIFAGSIPWLSQMYLYLGAVIGLSFMILFVSLDLGREIRKVPLPSGAQSRARATGPES